MIVSTRETDLKLPKIMGVSGGVAFEAHLERIRGHKNGGVLVRFYRETRGTTGAVPRLSLLL